MSLAKIGGRKFLLVEQLVLVLLLMNWQLIPLNPAIGELLKWIVGLYMGGNVGAAGVQAVRDAIGKKGATAATE